MTVTVLLQSLMVLLQSVKICIVSGSDILDILTSIYNFFQLQIQRKDNGFGFTLRHFIVYPPEVSLCVCVCLSFIIFVCYIQNSRKP